MPIALAAVSTLLFIAVAMVVGVRLLLLAKRTRGLPEFSLGAGLFVIVGIGYPLMLAGRANAADSPESARWLMATGALAMACGWTGVWIFTWRVFRAGSQIAMWVTLGCIGVMLGAAGASAHRVSTLADLATLDFGSIRHTGVAILAMLVNAWAAIESSRYYARMSKRVAVGLADPIVANRFLLFALVMGFSFASTGVPTVASMLGIDAVRSPPVLIASAVTGVLCSGTLWLAFLPPKVYVRRLRTA